MSRVNAGTLKYRVSKVVLLALLFGTLQVQSSNATVSTPSLTPDSPGVNTSVYFNGNPIREGASIPNTSSILIGTAALLSPGLGQREIITNFDAKTIYQSGTAKGPEGWTLAYQKADGTWVSTEPSPASSVKAIKAFNPSVAAGAISGTSQNFSTQTQSNIPSNSFSAASGGDGWGLTFYDNYVFNIFHHENTVQLVCNSKSKNASNITACPWSASASAVTPFADYRTGGRSDAWVNPNTGKLYTLTSPKNDVTSPGPTGVAADRGRAGFLCIDIGKAIATSTTPAVCNGGNLGFYSAEDTATVTSNMGQLNDVVNVGNRIFGLDVSHTPNSLLCFDTSTNTRCANSPINVGGGAGSNGGNPFSTSSRVLAISEKIYVQTTTSSSNAEVRCFNASDLTLCSGWLTPKTSSGDQTKDPLVITHLNTSGVADGLCSWYECYALNGDLMNDEINDRTLAAAATPEWINPFNTSKLPKAHGGEQWWMRGVTTLGRAYWGSHDGALTLGGGKYINCFDYSTQEACANFGTNGLLDVTSFTTLVYDIRVDPVNPACLWVNNNDGKIFNLNYNHTSGAFGCTGTSVITLQPSQFAPRYSCSTDVGISSWTNIKLNSLVGGSGSGSIALTVRNAAGEIVSGWGSVTITPDTELSMSSLAVALSGSRPTFSFAFSGWGTAPTSATIALNYLGKGPELCANAVITGTDGDAVSVTGILNDAISASPSVDAVRAFVIGDSTTNRYYTLPSAPRDLVGTGLNTTVTLTFKPPLDDGGYTLGSYKYSIDGTNYSTANSIVDNGDGTRSITITGLTAGQTYTNAFKVAATNPLGTGPSATIASLTVQRLSLDVLGDTKVDQGPLSMLTSVDSMAVTYTVSPASVCTQSAGVITLVAVGTCTVTADQAGDATHVAATTTKSFQVLAADVVIVAPGAPTSLLASRGSGQIGLSWTAPASNGGSAITDYVIQYLYGGTWIPFVDGTSNSTSALVTGLTNGTSYDFRVAAVNSAGQGNWSTSLTATPATVPGAVTSLTNTRTDLTTTSAALTWTAPSSNGSSAITDYSIQFKWDEETTWVDFTDSVSAVTGATVTGLEAGKKYDFQVSAKNAIGTGSSVSTLTLRNTDGNASSILNWDAPAVGDGNNINRYQVEYRILGSNTWTLSASTDATTTSTLTGLINGTAYQVRVGAITSGSGVTPIVTSAYTSTVLVTPRTIPAAPVVTATPGTSQVTLNWSAPVNNGAAITDYVIKYRIKDDLSWITKIDGVNTNTSYVVPNLLNATTYDFQVLAKNSAGDGVGSTVVTGKPFTTPSAPTGISPLSGQGAVTVTWNIPTSDGGSPVTDYSIQYKKLSDTSWIDFVHSASIAQSVTVNSLLQLSNYSFRLAAVNAAGTGAFSDAIFGTTRIVAPAITLTSTSGSITIGQAMPVYGVNSTGGTVSSYSVSTLPGGLSFNTSTGVISGTPAALMSASIFTITATNASGTATATYTLTVSAVPVTVPTPVAPAPVVQTGPPPSTLKTITSPKISRDDNGYYCEIGKYVFLREGRTEETPKLTTREFSFLLNGKVIDTLKSAVDKVSFTKSDTYLDSTLTCQVEVGQENLTSTSYSLNYVESAAFSLTKKNAIEAADAKYYKDRQDAYAKKDLEFARLLAIKNTAIATSKTSKDTLASSMTYQKAYMAASNLWKKELADAASNRVLAKELAQKQYLDALEAAGISIYPVAVKAVVTPTPTPTPKPTPSPTPSPTATNVQPTAAMKLFGTFYMDTGSYFLNNSTKISLKALALKINATEVKQVLVYGHTDSRGGVNNTWLSQQRAKAVASYLRPLLRGKKLVIGWYASRKPAATGTSKADLAKNRRVEIYVK